MGVIYTLHHCHLNIQYWKNWERLDRLDTNIKALEAYAKELSNEETRTTPT